MPRRINHATSPGPPPQTQRVSGTHFRAQYRRLIRSTVNWLADHGLPASRYTRAFLNLLLPSREDSTAYNSPGPVPDQRGSGPATPDALERPPTTQH